MCVFLCVCVSVCVSSSSSSSSLSLSLICADPLSADLEDDPLASASAPHVTTGLYAASDEIDDSFEPWESKTPAILARYTTSEKLSLASDLVGGKGVSMTGDGVSDKVKSRLEELEEDTEQKEDEVTQQEFVARSEKLAKDLKDAWRKEQRVTAIKLVIQVRVAGGSAIKTASTLHLPA